MHPFLNFLADLPPPTLYKVETRKKFWIHASNIVCRVRGVGLDLCEFENAPKRQKCSRLLSMIVVYLGVKRNNHVFIATQLFLKNFHPLKKQYFVPLFQQKNFGMHYMLAHHIVVQHKLIEHCARRFVSITRLCTQCLVNLCCTTIWCAHM